MWNHKLTPAIGTIRRTAGVRVVGLKLLATTALHQNRQGDSPLLESDRESTAPITNVVGAVSRS